MKQYQKLLLGFVLGIVVGLIGYYAFPEKNFPFMKTFTDLCTLTGAVFLRMIFMVEVPLLVSALMLGVVDRFLDMCRTTLNVSGDLVIAKLVSASMGDDNDDKPNANHKE